MNNTITIEGRPGLALAGVIDPYVCSYYHIRWLLSCRKDIFLSKKIPIETEFSPSCTAEDLHAK